MSQAEISVGWVRGRQIPIAWLLAPFGVVAATSLVADWIWPSLVTDHPLVLLAMSAKNRFLLLTAPQLTALAFFVVGFVRLLLTDPLTYLLGREYGEQALGWIEDKTSTAKPGRSYIRGAERLFARAAPLVILIAPSALWCMLAGAARMRVVTFVTCNVVGTVGRLILFWYAADALRAPLESLLETIEEWQTPLIGVTVALGVLQTVRTRRRRSGAPVEAPELEVDVASAL
jgi:membrane protein DedA with SNARE-associated domain